jgi:hypothetical protein
MDIAAGDETYAIQMIIASLREETRDFGVQRQLFEERRTQSMAQAIVARARLPDVQVVPASGVSGASAVSAREAGDFGISNIGQCQGLQTGLCQTDGWSESVLHAAMGSRGNPFTTFRGVVPPAMETEWNVLRNYRPQTSLFTAPAGPVGSGYWATAKSHGAPPSHTWAFADDHGSLSISASRGGCNASGFSPAIESWVMTTEIEDNSDEHEWRPADPRPQRQDPAGIPRDHHTGGSCAPLCPSVWVRQVSFAPSVDDPDDAYGQPKAYVMLVRDSAQHTRGDQPWKLNFRFGFSDTSEVFDNRGERLHGNFIGGGLDISSQTAVATGMTYYHRKGFWREHPNLLNPFWRATLVPADVDRLGKGRRFRRDVQNMLGARGSEAWQGDAYDALIRAGFRGVH